MIYACQTSGKSAGSCHIDELLSSLRSGVYWIKPPKVRDELLNFTLSAKEKELQCLVSFLDFGVTTHYAVVHFMCHL